MNNFSRKYINVEEKNSIKFLMQKMGLQKKEFFQISEQYGVSASQLIELMQYSKYRFVYTNEVNSLCAPCKL